VKDAFRLAMIVGIVAATWMVIASGQDGLHAVLRGVVDDGSMRGPLALIWGFVCWMGYVVLVIAVLVAAILALSALGLLGWLLQKLAEIGRAIVLWVRSLWDGADVADPKKLPKAMRSVLADFQSRIKALETKTAGLQPPPPPKSAEEKLREQDELIRKMADELAKLKEAADA
jgi:hypothetical protein